jgi:hypothetical protein
MTQTTTADITLTGILVDTGTWGDTEVLVTFPATMDRGIVSDLLYGITIGMGGTTRCMIGTIAYDLRWAKHDVVTITPAPVQD